MIKLKNFAKRLWNDESGQGTAEYVLLIAIAAAVLIVFGPMVRDKMMEQLDRADQKMDQVGNF